MNVNTEYPYHRRMVMAASQSIAIAPRLFGKKLILVQMITKYVEWYVTTITLMCNES